MLTLYIQEVEGVRVLSLQVHLKSVLTLGLLGPGGTAFIKVYMLSPELVESETQHYFINIFLYNLQPSHRKTITKDGLDALRCCQQQRLRQSMLIWIRHCSHFLTLKLSLRGRESGV